MLYHIRKVCKRLNARDKFNAVRFRVRVDFFNFRRGITPTKVPEIRFTLHFIDIFRIEFERVIAHFFKVVDKILNRINRSNRVSGTVEHNAEMSVLHNEFSLLNFNPFSKVTRIISYHKIKSKQKMQRKITFLKNYYFLPNPSAFSLSYGKVF
jgi:hypothetical protein